VAVLRTAAADVSLSSVNACSCRVPVPAAVLEGQRDISEHIV